MNSDLYGIDNMCIGELTSVLYRHFQIFVNRQMKVYGINSSAFIFLTKIGEEPANQKQLSDSLCVDSAIATRSLKALEEKGLITRKKSAADARATMVRLTPKGMEIKQAALEVRQRWKNRVMADITEQQSKLLSDILKDMAKKALYQTSLDKEEKH